MRLVDRDLYIACAGIKPTSTVRPFLSFDRDITVFNATSQVPICLDLGTNTQRYLDDPLYIGVRRHRPTGQEVTFTSSEVSGSDRTPKDGRIHGRVHARHDGRVPEFARSVRRLFDGQCV
jgi:hypothetical protein